MSITNYIAVLIKRKFRVDWPEGFFEEVAGGWRGEPLQRLDQGIARCVTGYSWKIPDIPARYERLHLNIK